MEDLLRNYTAATVGEVKTELHSFYLEELRHVDSDCSQQGREDVHDHPLAPTLHLPVVVGSAHSKVPLHPHRYDQVDTCTNTYPRTIRIWIQFVKKIGSFLKSIEQSTIACIYF